MRRRRLLAWLVSLFIKLPNTDFNLAVHEACQYHQLIDDYIKSYFYLLAILSHSYHLLNQSIPLDQTKVSITRNTDFKSDLDTFDLCFKDKITQLQAHNHLTERVFSRSKLIVLALSAIKTSFPHPLGIETWPDILWLLETLNCRTRLSTHGFGVPLKQNVIYNTTFRVKKKGGGEEKS